MEAIQFELSMFKASPGVEHPGDQEGGDGGADGLILGLPGGGGAQQGTGGRVGSGVLAAMPIIPALRKTCPQPRPALFLVMNKGLAELEPDEQRDLELQVRQEEGRERIVPM